ncbi:hypothetical protein HYALB_00000128 [Hymenoscyphus albidus]|uniref:Zn(2)-C6 fungal-type domain-containing protein n=1 Tax=Hymenoscyphus albidus TaxID=595503 RepID=A0A9N9PZ09_9HELO|nr:hypothetical protein HYALB_00000128 [Hymenoscyphus albidus]
MAMMEETGKRKSTPRSKTGCKNCRLRRIKCGEERPSCSRCVKSGLNCTFDPEPESSHGSGSFLTFSMRPDDSGAPSETVAGYVPPGLKRKIEAQALRTQRKSRPVTKPLRNPNEKTVEEIRDYRNELQRVSPTTTSIPFQLPGNDEEKLHFYYFRCETLHDLGGHRHLDFWGKTVISYSQEEPVVRHAVLALSAFHRNRTFNQAIYDNNSMQQYNKALREVRKLMASQTNPPIEMILICCMIFYSIETTRGDHETASKHAKSGLQILKHFYPEMRAIGGSLKTPRKRKEIDRNLLALFVGTDLSLCGQDGYNRAPDFVTTTIEERSGKTPTMPAKFTSALQASVVSNKLVNWTFQIRALILRQWQDTGLPWELPPHLVKEIEIIQSELHRWTWAFRRFVQAKKLARASRDELDDILCHQHQILMFKVKFPDLLIPDPKMLAGDIAKSLQMDYETKSKYFGEILSIFETLAVDFVAKDERPRFTVFYDGSINSLSLIGIASGNDSMRQRAANLLKIWPQKSGLTDGKRIGYAIERSLEIARHRREEFPDEDKDVFQDVIMSVLQDPAFQVTGEAITPSKPLATLTAHND